MTEREALEQKIRAWKQALNDPLNAAPPSTPPLWAEPEPEPEPEPERRGASPNSPLEIQIAETQKHEAELLARIRESDPNYNPWAPCPSDQELQAQFLADQKRATANQQLAPSATGDEHQIWREARERCEEAAAALSAAEGNVERAAFKVRAEYTALEQYQHSADDLIRAEVDLIKQRTPAGEPVPVYNLPRARAEQEEHLKIAQLALARLQQELDTARADHNEAMRDVQDAALRVVLYEIEKLASEVLHDEAVAAHKRKRLNAYARIQFSTAEMKPTNALISARVKQLLNDPPANHTTEAADPDEWVVLFNSLMPRHPDE